MVAGFRLDGTGIDDLEAFHINMIHGKIEGSFLQSWPDIYGGPDKTVFLKKVVQIADRLCKNSVKIPADDDHFIL